jgi:hypothetical protein
MTMELRVASYNILRTAPKGIFKMKKKTQITYLNALLITGTVFEAILCEVSMYQIKSATEWPADFKDSVKALYVHSHTHKNYLSLILWCNIFNELHLFSENN